MSNNKTTKEKIILRLKQIKYNCQHADDCGDCKSEKLCILLTVLFDQKSKPAKWNIENIERII